MASSTCNGKITSYSIPTKMEIGKKYSASITMLNTGSEKWKKNTISVTGTGVSHNPLCSYFKFNGCEAYVYNDKIVNPKDKYIFKFYLTPKKGAGETPKITFRISGCSKTMGKIVIPIKIKAS